MGKLLEMSMKIPCWMKTFFYEWEFPDGTTKEYAVNIIAENTFNESDSDGHRGRNMLTLVNHKKTGDALLKENGYITTKSGQQHM